MFTIIIMFCYLKCLINRYYKNVLTIKRKMMAGLRDKCIHKSIYYVNVMLGMHIALISIILMQ